MGYFFFCFVFQNILTLHFLCYSYVHNGVVDLRHGTAEIQYIIKGQTTLCIIHLLTSVALKSRLALNQRNF